MTKEYREGFKIGLAQAKGFHKGTINNRESQLMCLSPYCKLTEPEKASQWRRGRLDGYEDYMKGVPSIAPVGISI